MIELNVTFFIQLVNFLIVLLLLNIILYKPIRGMLSKRAEIMSDKVSEVEKFSASAQEKMEAYESELDKARGKAQEIRTDFKGAGYARESEIVDAASGEAMSMVKAAREKISKEKDAAVTSLRKEVEKFAEKATEKILTKA